MSNQDHEFEKLVQDYENMIYHVFKRYHLRHHLEDFYNEGLLALYQASQSYVGEKGDFGPYAYSHIRGRILNLLKKELRVAEHTVGMVEELDFPCTPTERHEDWLIVMEASKSLSSTEQKIFKMHYLEDTPLVRVAKDLEISYDRAKLLKNRIRNKMRQSIQSI